MPVRGPRAGYSFCAPAYQLRRFEPVHPGKEAARVLDILHAGKSANTDYSKVNCLDFERGNPETWAEMEYCGVFMDES